MQEPLSGLIVDVSQTAGAYDIDLSDGIVTAACFTGHKSLYGPGGTGGIVIRRGVEVLPSITGGDGVHTFEREQLQGFLLFLKRGQPMSPALPAECGCRTYLKKGNSGCQAHQEELARSFIPAVKAIPGICLYGDFSGPRVGVYSLNLDDAESAVVSDILWETYHMATRPAYHCAPLMHEPWGRPFRGRFAFLFLSLRPLKTSWQRQRL